MPTILRISSLFFSIALCSITWYAALFPFWLIQSGKRDTSTYYSQGIGIWLNYTEHLGDPEFDPGNSLWLPRQQTGAESFTTQCAVDRASFCTNGIGELHKQYCEVMDIYCGLPMTTLQVLLSFICGLAILIVLWLLSTFRLPHRTIADAWLTHLCIFQGLCLLIIGTIWYFVIFNGILHTAFYKDQHQRCTEKNPDDRSCWQVGPSMYSILGAGAGYPILSVLCASLMNQKYRYFQKRLRKFYDQTTKMEVLDLPPPIHVKAMSINESEVITTPHFGQRVPETLQPKTSISTPNSTTSKSHRGRWNSSGIDLSMRSMNLTTLSSFFGAGRRRQEENDDDDDDDDDDEMKSSGTEIHDITSQRSTTDGDFVVYTRNDDPSLVSSNTIALMESSRSGTMFSGDSSSSSSSSVYNDTNEKMDT